MNPLRLVVLPQVNSSFNNGLSVEYVAPGNAPAVAAAAKQPDGTWVAELQAVYGTQIQITLIPTGASEPVPYAWIDTSRFFIPVAGQAAIYTVEGMYGISSNGLPVFDDPPSRSALMQASFGSPIVAANIFDPVEMPHGPTLVGNDRYFVLHAPHAVTANLVLIDTNAAGNLVRRLVAMNLTTDARYWWCSVPAADAPPGKSYRFALNGNSEVLDPAARQVLDQGDFQTVSQADPPGDPNVSWCVVVDETAIRRLATQAPWRTLGWESLLIYELHARRFIDTNPGALTPLQIVADELKAVNRQGNPGYLSNLPVTALELMPVHEFPSGNPWGYTPSFYFAVDDFYGGALGLAELVNTAHQVGRGVLLDLVYNHCNDSPLTVIAPDVYANGNFDGDRINCGHPMVIELLRQATVYLVRTFGVDGYRFDSTTTILELENGWNFLSAIHTAIRSASNALGRNWPYCVAENDPKGWNLMNPAWSVMDGRWNSDEMSALNYAASNPWVNGSDNSGVVQTDMAIPESWIWPFYCATRFAESHDSASDQQFGRIAARPPYGQGFQMAKAVGAMVLLSNGVPMIFCGQEVGDVTSFTYANNVGAVNPQQYDLPAATANDNTRILSWFRQIMGLRNDPTKGLRGDSNLQTVNTGIRTIAFSCGNSGEQLFVVVTLGTSTQQQNSSWLGLPSGIAYKEIFNSSWPAFQVEFEQEQSNGGYSAQIYSGQILNLPYCGAVVLERC